MILAFCPLIFNFANIVASLDVKHYSQALLNISSLLQISGSESFTRWFAPLAPPCSPYPLTPHLPPCLSLTEDPRLLKASWGYRQVPRAQGMQGEQAGDFLRTQGGSRDPGMLRERGEWAGASWGPREVPGTQGCSGSEVEQAGREGSKLGDFLRPQGGSRDPGMLGAASMEQGSKLGASWGPREVSGNQRCSGDEESKLGSRAVSWGLPKAPGRFMGT